MADSTLGAIRKLVRQYTHSPFPAQLSDAEIDEKVNVFVLYDFPNHLRLFSLRTTLEFFTQPYIDIYETNTTDPTHPLYNFKNRYVAVHEPIFIAGIQGSYTQYRNSFFAMYPLTNMIQNVPGLVGNGTTGPYVGQLTGFPVMQNNVVISAFDVNGTAMILVDYPINNVWGYLSPPNTPIFPLPIAPPPIPPVQYPNGWINYITGAFSATFPNAAVIVGPNPAYPINYIKAETIPYQPGKPYSLLYYDNIFTVRPIPNMVYPIKVEVDIRPTELLDANASPHLEQWFQFIAVGASKKIFETRMDMDSVALIMPLYKEQMNLVNRASLEQGTEMRSQTIYNNSGNRGSGWWNNATWPF